MRGSLLRPGACVVSFDRGDAMRAQKRMAQDNSESNKVQHNDNESACR
jgi:hypothetical protein